MEKFEFIVFIVIWERLLIAIHKASQELQSVQMDLSVAVRLLSMAVGELQYLRNSWTSVTVTATALAAEWGVSCQFTQQRVKRTKKFFDELASDQRLQDPEAAFKVHVFYAIVDTALSQLNSRFQGQNLVCDTFSFLQPAKLLELSDSDLELAARKLQEEYKHDVGIDFPSELRSFRREFRSELTLQSSVSVLDIFKLLMSSHMAASVPELATVCALFLTLPVTVASAERSFSKLKLIKTYLRSTISQDRLDGLSLLAIESDAAKKLDTDSLIDKFANSKARAAKFK